MKHEEGRKSEVHANLEISTSTSESGTFFDVGGVVEEATDINVVTKAEEDVAEWRLEKKTHQEREAEDQRMMIQNIISGDFNKVCIDSGAGESVCPVEAFPSYETKKTAKTGMSYTAAGGDSLVNVGEKRPEFTAGGVNAWMAFQATTKVQKPLAAATRITEKGNGIWLDEEGCESYILKSKSNEL